MVIQFGIYDAKLQTVYNDANCYTKTNGRPSREKILKYIMDLQSAVSQTTGRPTKS